MLFRRAAGVLAAMVLVPSLLTGRDRNCTQHEEHGARLATSIDMAHMAGHEHHRQGSDPAPVPRDHHPEHQCCPAMGTCSSGSAVQVADTGLTGWSTHNELPGDVVTHSRSRVESPDPPPPKA